MEMTSREIVRRCIEFREPPRIGLHFAVAPIDGKTWRLSDFAEVRCGADPDVHLADGEDEWNLPRETFDTTGENMGQVKKHPLGEGWHQLETYRFPDFSKAARYSHLAADVARAHAEGKYVKPLTPQATQALHVPAESPPPNQISYQSVSPSRRRSGLRGLRRRPGLWSCRRSACSG